MRMTIRPKWILLFTIWPSLLAHAQGALWYQKDFPPDEFKARWEKVFNKIGSEAVAVVQGAPQTRGFMMPRQTNEFYYLCGIETAQPRGARNAVTNSWLRIPPQPPISGTAVFRVRHTSPNSFGLDTRARRYWT